MKRDKFGEWVIEGNTKLLNMERQVHQEYRLNKDDEKLRLEANFWAGPTLSHPSPDGWVNGVWDHIGMDRPLHLLREGIIDAWIGSYQPDLPDKNDPDLIVIDLCKNPVKLVEDKLHPLSDKKIFAQKIQKPIRLYLFLKDGFLELKLNFVHTGYGPQKRG